MKQLVDYQKKFLIIGNMNAITYKEVFPLIKENKMWLGPSISSGDREFRVPDSYPITAAGWRIDNKGEKISASERCPLVYQSRPWTATPTASAYDDGGQFEVQQTQRDKRQGSL